MTRSRVLSKVILLSILLLVMGTGLTYAQSNDSVGGMMDNFLIKSYYPLREVVVSQAEKVSNEYKSVTGTVKVIGQMIAFTLFIYAFVRGMALSNSPKEVMSLIVKMFVLTGCIALVPIFLELGDEMAQSVASMLSGSATVTDDSMIRTMLNDLRQAAYAVQPPSSWLDVGAAVSNALAVASMMLAFGCVAAMDVVLLILNLVRSLILTFSEIFLPVGIGMMAVGMLAGIGRSWIMATIGVLLWPVGWGLVMTFVRPITRALGDQMMKPETQATGTLINFMVVLYILVAIGICVLWVAVTRIIGRAMQGSGDIAGPTIGAALSMPMKGAGMAARASGDIAMGAAKASATGGASAPVDAGRMAARAASRK